MQNGNKHVIICLILQNDIRQGNKCVIRWLIYQGHIRQGDNTVINIFIQYKLIIKTCLYCNSSIHVKVATSDHRTTPMQQLQPLYNTMQSLLTPTAVNYNTYMLGKLDRCLRKCQLFQLIFARFNYYYHTNTQFYYYWNFLEVKGPTQILISHIGYASRQ